MTETTLPAVLPELRPALQALVSKPPIDYSRLDVLRAESDAQVTAMLGLYVQPPELAEVTDFQVPVDGATIPGRLYRPTDGARGAAHVHLHGGGWMTGSITSADLHCRNLAGALGDVVLTIGYRLAPEHPWPGPVEDCYAALQWIVDNAPALGIDGDAVSIGGESAGGNIAAAVALMSRDRGGPPLVAQWLDVPATDLTLPVEGSLSDFAGGYGLDLEDLRRCLDLYLQPEDRTHPYASPLLAPDLTGLPPAIVTVAECDPLRDQGEAYARRLADAGVAVRQHRYDGHLHATMVLTGLHESCRRYQSDVVNGLRELRAIGTNAPASS